jgi:hypothetical protein
MISSVLRPIAALLFLAAALAAHAQEPGAIVAVKLSPGETIRMDGTLSDPAWQRAPVFSDFVTKEPVFGQKPVYETRVQVMYDDRYVYVGIQALDPKPELIREVPVRHDGVLRTQDFVLVYLDPIGKKNSAQWFRIGASGSTADGMQTASDDSEDFAPDFDFDAAAKLNDKGYTAVLRVPFASLRYTREVGRNWRIMVARRVPRENFHLVTSVPIAPDAPNWISNMQELRGIELPAESHFLTIRPSLTLRRTRTQDVPNPVVTENKLQPTLDMKWRATPELVIDGTIKPDFSQVDLDVPQLAGNSRFALFYPEKRPFFFEATDVMRAPTENALYTRTFTQPNWGLRATWRSASHAGTAMAIDDKGGGLVLLPGPYATGYADQPGSKSVVARELADVGPLQLGGILAARKYENGIGENTVAGPDVAWQATDTLRFRAQLLHSHTTAQPDPLTGLLAKGPATDGNRLFLRGVNQTENNFVDVSYNDIGTGFRHDSGFVNQAGIRGIDARVGEVWRPLGPFNEFQLFANASVQRDRVTGETVKSDPYPGIFFLAARNTAATFEWHGWSKVRSASGGPLMHENYLNVVYTFTPLPWIPLVDSNFQVGRLADVIANQVRPGVRANVMVRIRPIRQFEIEPRISYATLSRDGKQTYRETALSLNAIWFFNANQNIRFIAQRTLLDRLPEPGVLEEHDRGKVASVTYTWRKSMGTVFYVGASYSKGRFPLPALSRGTEAFVKMQFDYDEMRRGFF